MGYYDFPEPSLEPPDDHIVCFCGECKGEIYRFDPTIFYDGVLFHEECAQDEAKVYAARPACEWD